MAEDDAVVLSDMASVDNVVVESNSIVAAGAVVLENTRIESGSVYAGVPAKKVKEVSPELFEGEIQRIANNYTLYSSWFKPESGNP